MINPLMVNQPYPVVENGFCDRYSATVISPAYCGLHGELSACLSFTYGEFNFNGTGDYRTCELFNSIALAETFHFKALGQALLNLGVDPVFTECPPYVSSCYCTQGITLSRQPEKILTDAITMKMVAIDRYEKMLKLLKNKQVCTLIERILSDERLHFNALKERFESCTVKIFY